MMSRPDVAVSLGAGISRWLRGEWSLLRFAALILAVALSPSVWDGPARMAAAQALCRAVWRVLPGYLAASALVTAVLTRIVAVTAASYGLSHLALEAVVRVFVIELLPLAAALFVAARSGLDAVARLAPVPAPGGVLRAPALAQIVPVVAGNALALVTLIVLSGMLALAVAYLVIYGFSPWALAEFTRLAARVFDPVTAPILAFKAVSFAVAVGVVPATVVLDASRRDGATIGEMRVMARMLLMLLVIEAAALALKQI